MAAGDLITQDYQYEYNDLLLGCDTPLDVEELSNFVGYPTVRSSIDDAFGRHGGVPGRHYLPSRLFTMTFNIMGTSDDDVYALLRYVTGTAFGVRSDPASEIPFVYQHPGITKRYINCRPVDLNWPVDRLYALAYPHISVRFEATDPRHYALEVKSTIASLPTSGGGLDFPLSFSGTGGLDFGGAGISGSTTLANLGNAPANWHADITGPVTDPVIEMVSDTTGEEHTLEIDGLTLGVGEVLTFNSKDRSVKVGTQSRRSFLTPQSIWTTLPPYPETLTVSYRSADVPSTTSTATFYWSDAVWGE